MKKYLVVLNLLLLIITAITVTNSKLNAQIYNKNDSLKLVEFFNQPSAVLGKTNAQVLSVNTSDAETWDFYVEWTDIPTDKRIESISFSSDDLAGKLDLSNCGALEALFCANNEISELILTGCSKLKTLDCQNNKLTQLILSGSNDIEELYCNDNDLEELILTDLTNLNKFDCQNNLLIFIKLKMPSNFASMDKIDFNIGRQKPYLPKNFEKFGSKFLSRGFVIDLKNIEAKDFAWFKINSTDMLESTYYSENAGEFTFTANSGLVNTNIFCEMRNDATHLNMVVPTVEFTLSYIYNRNDVEKLKKFLQYNNSQYGNNGKAVNIAFDTTDPNTFNVTWESRRYNDTTENRVTTIYWHGTGIEGNLDLTGCDYLTVLNVENNRLTNLIFGNRTIIKELNCGRNLLKELKLTSHTELLDLKCYNNNIKELDLTQNTGLEYLYCENNELTSINLTGLTWIRTIYCNRNNLSTLDISNLEILRNLICDDNQIKELATYNSKNLEILSAKNNKLTSLDLVISRDLKTLDVANNNLKYLDLTGLGKMVFLSCENNSLNFKSLKIPVNLPSTCILSPQEIIGIEVFNKINDFWVSKNNIIDLSNYADNVTTFEWKKEDEDIITTTNDAVFDAAPYDGQIIYCKLSSPNFPTLILSTVKFRAGYKYNDNDVARLRRFLDDTSKFGTINGNLISENYNSQDPSTFPVEWKVINSNNSSEKCLVGIDWHNHIDLKGTIDLSNCSNLEKIDISCSDNTKRNAITSVILKGCSKIKKIEAKFNQLTNLDLTGCTNLEVLDCFNNRLETLVIPSKALTQVNASNNILAGTLDIANNKKLVELNVANNNLDKLEIAGCNELRRLNCSSNQLYTLNLALSTNLVELNISNNSFENIDITKLLNLREFNCSNNRIKSFDISKSTEIVSLRCSNNRLETLDLSGIRYITELFAHNNSLTFSTIFLDVKPNELFLNPQANITPDNIDNNFVLKSDTLDLSKFGEMEKSQTIYQLKLLNGEIISDYVSVKEGRFTNFGKDLKGKTIYCEMTNPEFPDLILRTIRFALTPPEKYNDNDVEKLRSFLNQSIKNGGKTIGEYLNANYDPNKPETYSVTWCPINGEMRVVSINWENKQYLNGRLDLTGCEYLDSITCTGNSTNNSGLSEIIVNGCINIEYINVAYNELNRLDLEHLKTSSLSTLYCANNKLTFATTRIFNAPTNFNWNPQEEVKPSALTSNVFGSHSIKTNSIDLSSYGADYYKWKMTDGSDINVIGNNGNFILPDALIGRTIYCIMTSRENKFADLELNTVGFLVDFTSSITPAKNNLFDLSIYPNPTSNEANISLDFVDNAENINDLEIVIYDMQGLNLGTLYNGEYKDKLKINFSSFSTGNYFLLFQSGNKHIVKSINIIK